MVNTNCIADHWLKLTQNKKKLMYKNYYNYIGDIVLEIVWF